LLIQQSQHFFVVLAKSFFLIWKNVKIELLNRKVGDLMKIGDRIKALREKKGWTQLELADKAGINNSVLSRIEANKRPVEDYLLAKFSDIFDVNADYLLGRLLESSEYSDQIKVQDESIYRMIARAKELPPDQLEQAKSFIDFLYEQGNKKKD
jgi:transcriptional regulator with XRE-family HTH domain